MREPFPPLTPQTFVFINVQAAFDRLQETILSSPHFWSRTLVNEDVLLDQIDQIRLSLPSALQEAEDLLQQRDDILEEAHQYAEQVALSAERRAKQLLEESVILRQAQAQAEQILLQARREQEDLRRQTQHEVERLQQDANRYIDQVLQELETRLLESLRVIRNGRHNL